MHFIDTHTHLYSNKFKADRADALRRAQEAGVHELYLPNIDHSSIDDMLELEASAPNRCFAMMGLHPVSVKKGFEKELYIVEDWLNKRDFIAVGEIGTDLYWDKSFFPQQAEAFTIQVNLALKHDLPIVIHCRESIPETIELLQALKSDKLRGVFHCFTGTLKQAEAIIDLGFLMGIGGVLTFKNSGLDTVVKEIDLAHLVLETDSPYLAPVPHRGKRNESAYVPLIAQKLAEVKEVEIEEIAQKSSANARKLFGRA